ncbi:hypothetical protein CWB41_02480 [Methylovirgula ligni]|uniref:Homogentisate 1,2-dioxygenase n=1 Tax=Methylovirgula ligni TaxID=569860 RepID=A0A3D9Z225_9HYPH|nr:hypothetical protein [Methylovirgula ligni]QAY94748.1 hypothetical protein CWB41_02480 [Methylovirgula ligni]REF87359.1 hypothetical protein DES32_0979 [Methylovirgula ligni]
MMPLLRMSAVLIATLAVVPAMAEPTGCDHFKWPLDHEKALLSKPIAVASGGAATLATGETLTLDPEATAKLPQAPSRPPKFPGSYAGFVTLAAPASAGIYRVTLTRGAWIDVVQDGHLLKTVDHTGATGCAGLAKSVKFDLKATPFTVEISSSTAPSVALVVTPD